MTLRSSRSTLANNSSVSLRSAWRRLPSNSLLSGDTVSTRRNCSHCAAKLVTSGFVRVNGQRTDNPAKAITLDDVITLALSRTTLVIRVVDLGGRRGPASEARQLYANLDGSGEPLATNGNSG